MLGTALFALGAAAAIASLITRSNWIAGLAAALLIPGLAIVYRVGRSLR